MENDVPANRSTTTTHQSFVVKFLFSDNVDNEDEDDQVFSSLRNCFCFDDVVILFSFFIILFFPFRLFYLLSSASTEFFGIIMFSTGFSFLAFYA